MAVAGVVVADIVGIVDVVVEDIPEAVELVVYTVVEVGDEHIAAA
jgi:hypothetical protein